MEQHSLRTAPRPIKLELIQQKEEIQLVAAKKQFQNTQLQAQINHLQAEKREQVRGLEELTTLQQEQLEVQRKEIDRLFSSVRSLQIQPREDTPLGSGQREVTV